MRTQKILNDTLSEIIIITANKGRQNEIKYRERFSKTIKKCRYIVTADLCNGPP